MKPGGGKAKGSGYEREVAKFLSRWITGKEKELVFWRSPSSGALCTISNVLETSGDLIAIKPEGEWFLKLFSVEIKTGYPHADFFQHFKDMKGDVIKEFWLQCQTDARKSKKYGMLIFKKKGLKPIVGIDSNMKELLLKNIYLLKSLMLAYDDGTPDINFYDMEMFFNTVTPDMIRKFQLNG